jgi:phytoene dehydrogenase-like protein
MMHDVVIIGGGHNGLVCSAYLAMAGLKVLVLDQRPVAGGAAVTEEFSPGFRNSVASYAVSLLNPKIIRDLDLAVHGLRIVDRPVSNFLPLGDGSFLKVGGSRTKREVAKFSARDAERLDDGRLGEVIENLCGLALGKLGAIEIDADRNAAIGGARESLHDWPVRQDIGGHIDFVLGAID